MIDDFWLGILLATAVALAVVVLCVATAAAWLLGWLSKYARVELRKDKAGAVVLSAEVRAR